MKTRKTLNKGLWDEQKIKLTKVAALGIVEIELDKSMILTKDPLVDLSRRIVEKLGFK